MLSKQKNNLTGSLKKINSSFAVTALIKCPVNRGFCTAHEKERSIPKFSLVSILMVEKVGISLW